MIHLWAYSELGRTRVPFPPSSVLFLNIGCPLAKPWVPRTVYPKGSSWRTGYPSHGGLALGLACVPELSLCREWTLTPTASQKPQQDSVFSPGPETDMPTPQSVPGGCGAHESCKVHLYVTTQG